MIQSDKCMVNIFLWDPSIAIHCNGFLDNFDSSNHNSRMLQNDNCLVGIILQATLFPEKAAWGSHQIKKAEFYERSTGFNISYSELYICSHMRYGQNSE